jgi:molecular chaperone GrpE
MSDGFEGRDAGFGAESAGGPAGQRPADSTSEPGAGSSSSARPDRSGSTESAPETANRCPPEAGREPDRVNDSGEPGQDSGEPDLRGAPGISEELATTAVADESFAESQGVPPAPEGLEPEAGDPAGVAANVVAKERDEYRDALIRLQADFENYKKRIAKQQDELRDRAAETLIEKLLPVLDTADLALAHGGGEDVKQICAALFSALDREGLERIDDLGAAFDPTLHDAVAHEPGDGHTQEVAEVMRAGYRWRGRVLRPAMVKVRG